MTVNEMKLSRTLGCHTYTVYSYLKLHGDCRNKEINYDIGVSDQTRHRAITALKKHKIIRVFGRTSDRQFEIQSESEWEIK